MQNSVIQKQLNNYVIYCHKNKINSKCYIGITQQKPKRRWQNGVGYKTQNFYRAIEKYGWNNFEHIILEEGLSLEEATKKERIISKNLILLFQMDIIYLLAVKVEILEL